MDDPSAVAQSAVPLCVGLRLAVVPFASHDAPPRQAFLGRALADQIAAGLSRFARLDVVSRHTSFALAQHPVTALFDELEIDRLVTGSIETRGDRLHVVLRIHDRPEGDPCGQAESVAPLTDCQALLADITDQLAAVLDRPSPLAAVETARRRRMAPDAFLLVLEATEALWTMGRQGSKEAATLLDKALAQDPDNPVALALSGFVAARAFRRGWLASMEQAHAQARQQCGRAMTLDPDDPVVLWSTAFAESMLFRRYSVGADLVRRSVVIDPSASHAWTWGSLFLSYARDFDGAIAFARRSIAVSPRDPMAVTQHFAGALASVHGRRYRDAIDFADAALTVDPDMVNVLRLRACACAHLGRLDEARAAIAKLRAHDPQETIALIARVNPLREWPGFSHFLDGLRASGMPEA